jgi:hypothetical protein
MADNKTGPDGGATISIGTISSSTAFLKTQLVFAAATLSQEYIP